MLLENLIAAVLGLGLHFTMKWASVRAEATSAGLIPPGFMAYVRTVPAQSAVSLFGTGAVFWVAFTMDWLNPGMALASGWMGNSMAENLAKQFAGKMPK